MHKAMYDCQQMYKRDGNLIQQDFCLVFLYYLEWKREKIIISIPGLYLNQ